MPIKPSTTPARELLVSIRTILITAHSRFTHTGVTAIGKDADLFLHDPKTDAYFRILVTPSTEADYRASVHPISFRRLPNPALNVPFSRWTETEAQSPTSDSASLLGTTRQAEAAEQHSQPKPSPWESVEPHPYTTWQNSTLGICSTPLDETGCVVTHATAYICSRRADDTVHQTKDPS